MVELRDILIVWYILTCPITKKAREVYNRVLAQSIFYEKKPVMYAFFLGNFLDVLLYIPLFDKVSDHTQKIPQFRNPSWLLYQYWLGLISLFVRKVITCLVNRSSTVSPINCQFCRVSDWLLSILNCPKMGKNTYLTEVKRAQIATVYRKGSSQH